MPKELATGSAASSEHGDNILSHGSRWKVYESGALVQNKCLKTIRGIHRGRNFYHASARLNSVSEFFEFGARYFCVTCNATCNAAAWRTAL